MIVTGVIQEIRERSHSGLKASVVRLSASRERLLGCGDKGHIAETLTKMSLWYGSYKSCLEENSSAVYL